MLWMHFCFEFHFNINTADSNYKESFTAMGKK